MNFAFYFVKTIAQSSDMSLITKILIYKRILFKRKKSLIKICNGYCTKEILVVSVQMTSRNDF